MCRSKTLRWVFAVVVVIGISCADRLLVAEKAATIAVWDLEDASPLDQVQPDLGEILSSQIVETLKEKRNVIVVERERLILALEELGLGTTSLVDENTRLELGKLVGAQLMVFGIYQFIGGMMRLDLRLVEVETGSVLKAIAKTTSDSGLSAWLNAAKGAADELL